MDDRPDGIFVGLRRMAIRLAAWTFVACVSAGPSLVIALPGYHGGGLIVGIAVWIVLLTLVSSTVAFVRFERVRGVRRTLWLGYGVRVVVSAIPVYGWFVDLYAGSFSVELGERLGFDGNGFTSSLAITLIQGAALNAIVIVLMLLAFPFVRRLTRPAWDGVERCRACGYDLRGRTSRQCPECGDATVVVLPAHDAASRPA